jgi:hypothetical protein
VAERRAGILAALPLLAAACTSAVWEPEGSPYSQAEVKKSLAPVSQIERGCYRDSVSQRAGRKVQLEMIAYVNERGHVHVDPVLIDPHDPGLTECVRARLSQLQFAAKGRPDQFHLRFELQPSKL